MKDDEDQDEGEIGAKASVLEIEAAIQALDDNAWFRIRKFAELKAYAGCPWDGDDLVQESLLRIIEGKRQWNKKLDFPVFFQGVIRSIANHKYTEWKKDKETESTFQPSETATPLDTMMDSEKCGEMLGLFKQRFSNDQSVLTVLECWEEGFSRTETIKYAEISAAQYEKIIKQIEGALKSVRDKVEGGKK